MQIMSMCTGLIILKMLCFHIKATQYVLSCFQGKLLNHKVKSGILKLLSFLSTCVSGILRDRETINHNTVLL